MFWPDATDLLGLDPFNSGVPLLRGGVQSPSQFLVAVAPMLRQVVHGSGRLFQVVQLRPVREPGALLRLDIVLNINKQAAPPVTLLWLHGWTGGSGNPGGNGFLRDIKFHLGVTFPVRHAPPPFFIRVWDIPASIFIFRQGS